MTIKALLDEVKFDEKGLVPAIVQDYETGDILMMAFMNEESLRRSMEIGETVFWSRSRQKYWHKGESSGNVQKIREIRIDCDGDCLSIKVEQIGGAACHAGYRSCFFRKYDPEMGLVIDSKPVFDPKKVYGQ